MDPVMNPFAPGAGTPPPELAGRDELRETIRIALERVRRGLPAKSILMVGLRGVGKTVLLDRMREEAEGRGLHTVHVEAPERRSLPALLAPELQLALIRLSHNEQARDLATRALRGLAGFAKALKVKYQDIEVGFDFDPEPGLADNGDLEHDLQALLEVAGAAAKKAGTALVLFVDELQYVKEEQLAALITALHRCAQRRLPVVLVGAGLPQLRGQMGSAKSYSERLFDFPEIGPLPEAAARDAIIKPANNQDVVVDEEAAEALLELATGGTPQVVATATAGADPFDHPDAQRRFRVMNDVEELERALAYPWEKWTIFLHPAQRQWVERGYNGPARVSGAAGTGKTIVALHRAVFLARAHPEARVLLTTFSETLANALHTKLRRLIHNEPRLGERLEVHAIDAIARRLDEIHQGPAQLASREMVRGLLAEAAAGVAGHKFSLGFLTTERISRNKMGYQTVGSASADRRHHLKTLRCSAG